MIAVGEVDDDKSADEEHNGRYSAEGRGCHRLRAEAACGCGRNPTFAALHEDDPGRDTARCAGGKRQVGFGWTYTRLYRLGQRGVLLQGHGQRRRRRYKKPRRKTAIRVGASERGRRCVLRPGSAPRGRSATDWKCGAGSLPSPIVRKMIISAGRDLGARKRRCMRECAELYERVEKYFSENERHFHD